MEIIKKYNNLVELHYSTKKDQVDHLSSIGVYLEDPIFQGKVMDSKEIKKKNRPVLQYLGFNFSSQDLEDYVSKNKSSSEGKLLESINKYMESKEPYYIISYVKGDTSTYEHEMAHYEYWSDEKIQDKMEKILGKKSYENLEKNMEKLGYHKSIINTEIYAFSKVFENSLPIVIKKDLMSIRKLI